MADEKTAQDIMNADVIGLLPKETVRDAVHKLIGHGISGMPVVSDAGRLVGIVTEEDLIALLHEEGPHSEVLDLPIEDCELLGESVITRRPVYVSPDTPRGEIARRLIMRRIKRVPVMNEHGVVVGIVSRRDVLKSWHREMS